MKNEDIFLKIVKQNPSIYQYVEFKTGTPYISAFDTNGRRTAKHVTYDDKHRALEPAIRTKAPTLSYDNGVYCWADGTNVYLFVEPDLARALWPNREPLQNGYVPMANGETLLTFPSLMHLRNTSYHHQKQKLMNAAQRTTQHTI
ncbi:MAG: hypothetical protein E7009_01830 [Alphaproteobacteria bacterium]|nr:hypothetical protein [Alphaproteobacteria bacterium]